MDGIIEDLGELEYKTDTLSSYDCKIDSEEDIIGNNRLSKECLALEKRRLSGLLELVEIGTEDPDTLINLGIFIEAGLAGLDRNLATAWDYYLKAARTEYKDAIEFVKKVFSDDSKEDVHGLLAKKIISKDSYPVFFDLAVKENNTELTAELLEYMVSFE